MTCLEFIRFCKSTPTGSLRDYKDGRINTLLLTADKSPVTYQIVYNLRYCLLVKQYLEDDKDAELAARILDYIISVVGAGSDKSFLPFSHSNWVEAVGVIKAKLNQENSESSSILMPQEEKAREYAQAVKRLTAVGLTYHFENHQIAFDGVTDVLNSLNKSVRFIGGRAFLNELFTLLDFKEERQRFSIPRQGNVSFAIKREVEYPYNYMMNLGLLHIRHDGEKVSNLHMETQRIMDLCRDICFVLYPVQAWDIWEDIFHVNKSALEYIRDLIFKKSIYGLEQSSPVYVEDLCQFVVEYHNSHPKLFKIQKDFTLDDFLTFMKWCFANAEDKRIKRVHRNRIHLRFTRRVLDGLLSTLCIRESQLNKGFLSPSDYLSVNYWPFPLIIDNKNVLTMMPRSIMAWWWMEALMAIIRSSNNNFESEMGTIVECYLKQIMSKQGINHVYGEYTKPVTGECDHVIVASDRLVFIEDKKKALTRSAYSGNTDDIILDLSKSLVLSQEQCHGHAVDLLKNKGLDLTDKNGGHHMLDDSVKVFDYISLSLSDYGPMQSRVLLNKVLELFVENRLCVDEMHYEDPAVGKRYQKEVGKINGYLDELCSHIKYLAGFYKNTSYKPFFDSWFITLEQMVFLLKQSHSSDELYSNMKKVKFCTHGIYDFFDEWDLMTPIVS